MTCNSRHPRGPRNPVSNTRISRHNVQPFSCGVTSHMQTSHGTDLRIDKSWNESHMWMSHVAHVDESCRTCEWVVSHMWISHVAHVDESCRTCEWVLSHMWMSRVAHVDQSCRTCEWVVSHMWMSRVAHVNESCRTCEWVLSHTWMSPVAHVNESCGRVISHTYFPPRCAAVLYVTSPCKWVTPHIWMSHVAHMNESRRICECVTSHIWMSIEFCRTFDWVLLHMWTSYVTHIFPATTPSRSCTASCEEYEISHIAHPCEWDMSQIWMSHATSMNESSHTYE